MRCSEGPVVLRQLYLGGGEGYTDGGVPELWGPCLQDQDRHTRVLRQTIGQDTARWPRSDWSNSQNQGVQ